MNLPNLSRATQCRDADAALSPPDSAAEPRGRVPEELQSLLLSLHVCCSAPRDGEGWYVASTVTWYSCESLRVAVFRSPGHRTYRDVLSSVIPPRGSLIASMLPQQVLQCPPRHHIWTATASRLGFQRISACVCLWDMLQATTFSKEASILGSFTELKDSTLELSGQLGNTALHIRSLNADDFLAGSTILDLLQVSCCCWNAFCSKI